jgi:poly-gamma-glutamate synthesis protein (capsule biosynthesis protein)
MGTDRGRAITRALLALSLLLQLPRPADAQETVTLRLTFLGDIMGHDVNYRMADYGEIYAGVADLLRGDDLTFANLELPVDPTRPVAGYPLFNGSPAYVRAALDAGIDVLSLANNHAFDGGEEGIFQTLRSLASLRRPGRRFWVSGVRGNTWREFRPVVIPLRGLRVGFLALAQFLNVPGGSRYVDVVDDADAAAVERLVEQIHLARSMVDLLVVSWHGDGEYSAVPGPGKVAFFRRLVEAGAQVVYSHHPHVMQRYELAPGPDGMALVMYSMGNFISGMTWRLSPEAPDPPMAATGESFALSVSVRCRAGACTVESARPLPLANYRNDDGAMVVGRLQDLADGTIRLAAGWQPFYQGRLRLMERSLKALPSLGAAGKREGR